MKRRVTMSAKKGGHEYREGWPGVRVSKGAETGGQE